MAAANREEARRQANLRLLQRSDPSITSILGSATHVVLYDFSAVSKTWEKQNIEGSMFLCNCSNGSFQLTILNRNSPQNHVISLTPDFQLQNQDPYLIFRQAAAAGATLIRGIWFPNSDERTSMNDLLTQTMVTVRSAPPPPPKPAATAAPPMDHGAATAALMQTLNIGGAVAATPAPVSSYAAAATATPTRQQPQQPTPLKSTPPPRQPSPSSSGTGHPPTLDKKSLQLALLSLIQDDRFLDLLHAQYMKVTHARSNGGGGTPK